MGHLRISSSCSSHVLLQCEDETDGRIHVGFDNKADPPIAIKQSGLGPNIIHPQICLTLNEARELHSALSEVIDQAQSSKLHPTNGRTVFGVSSENYQNLH